MCIRDRPSSVVRERRNRFRERPLFHKIIVNCETDHNLSVSRDLLRLSRTTEEGCRGHGQNVWVCFYCEFVKFLYSLCDNVAIMNQLFGKTIILIMLDHGVISQNSFSSRIPAAKACVLC